MKYQVMQENLKSAKSRFAQDPEIKQAIYNSLYIKAKELQALIRVFRQLGIDPLPVLREVLGREMVFSEVPESEEIEEVDE